LLPLYICLILNGKFLNFFFNEFLVLTYFITHRYRAEIIAIQPNKTSELVLDVYFLDYGDQQFVTKKDILELRADFLSLRFQAIECFLANVQPNNTSSKFEEWDKKAIESFETLVQVAQWKKLISKVVTYKERKSFVLQRSKQRESSPIPGKKIIIYIFLFIETN
jgi:tudor domain-containing protein 2